MTLQRKLTHIQWLLFSEELYIPANLNEASTSSRQSILNPQKILKNIRLKNLNRLIFTHLNIYSNQNTFESLVTKVNKNTDVFLISRNKLTPLFWRLNSILKGIIRNIHGSDLLLNTGENIPSSSEGFS